jgi:hypothetical protein
LRFSKNTLAFRRAMASAAPAFAGTCKLALLQMLAGSDKAANLATARAAIAQAAAAGAHIIALPECFNSPYATAQFPVYAEAIPTSAAALREAEHPSTHMLSTAAAAHGVYLVGGSIPEVSEGKVYNTCVAFGPARSARCVFETANLCIIKLQIQHPHASFSPRATARRWMRSCARAWRAPACNSCRALQQ